MIAVISTGEFLLRAGMVIGTAAFLTWLMIRHIDRKQPGVKHIANRYYQKADKQ